MSSHGFSQRYKILALWLSLLAVCAILLAPAATLAQELRSGQWIGLCSAGQASGTAGHADADGNHCELCALPGLVLGLPAAPALRAEPSGASRMQACLPMRPATDAGQPAIRGPPELS